MKTLILMKTTAILFCVALGSHGEDENVAALRLSTRTSVS